MTGDAINREVAIGLLGLFPPSLREDIALSSRFSSTYGVSATVTVTFHPANIAANRSALYPAIRKLDDNGGPVPLKLADGTEAELTRKKSDSESELLITLSDGTEHRIPEFWMLSSDREFRLKSFETEMAQANVPGDVVTAWRERISQSALSDDEVDQLRRDMDLNPQRVAREIRESMKGPESNVGILVPKEESYYERLIGIQGDTVSEFTEKSAKNQIERLLAWDFRRGLAQCLLFCAGPTLTGLIDISAYEKKEVQEFYTWLADWGDPFSQIAGVEVGLRTLKTHPELELTLRRIVEGLRKQDIEDGKGKLSLAANLFILVDGEFAQRRMFRGAKPYWRRLAAIAQSSVIVRELLAAGVSTDESTSWVIAGRGEAFFMQTLADMRIEPRWLPDLMSPEQLRAEFLMRARIVGDSVRDELPRGRLKELVASKGEDSLEPQTPMPFAFLPSPIEGGSDAPLPFPEDMLAELRAPRGEKVLEGKLFAGVINLALVFRLEKDVASLIASIIRTVSYRLSHSETGISFSFVVGLAVIAASTRCIELTDEVRTLARVLRRRGVLAKEPDNQMRIALIACASREELLPWCTAVGQWIDEIAREDIEPSTASAFRSHLRRLCQIEPALWHSLAKADAALASLADRPG